MSLARRSLSSVTWNSVSNLLQVVISLVRSILLARWLSLEVFDVYPLASSIIAVIMTRPGHWLYRHLISEGQAYETNSQSVLN